MAIRMRNNTKPDAICCECGEKQNEVLNMFDLCIGGTIFTICDVCNEKIFSKCLSAECMKNGRIKYERDMAIIRKRAQRSEYARLQERQEKAKLKKFKEEGK